MNSTYIDITGRKFGKLSVIERCGTKHGQIVWLCKCDCGNEKIVSGHNLRSGRTKSCGCLIHDANATRNKRHTKHNCCKTSLYKLWNSMKTRCNNKSVHNYRNYGGRGVTVCDEWNTDFVRFKEWAEKNGYKDGLTLDRIDVNGNYEPSNCRWVTVKQQENNRRNNHYLTIEGVTKTLTEWCELYKAHPSTVINRLNTGCTPKEALTLPLYYKWRSKDAL